MSFFLIQIEMCEKSLKHASHVQEKFEIPNRKNIQAAIRTKTSELTESTRGEIIKIKNSYFYRRKKKSKQLCAGCESQLGKFQKWKTRNSIFSLLNSVWIYSRKIKALQCEAFQ